MDSYDEYQAFIRKRTELRLKPVVGFPLFAAAFALGIFGSKFVGGPIAGLIFIFSLVLFPYYVVQLLMHIRMTDHLSIARRIGVKPSYVPSDSRGWAAIYIVTFLITAWLFLSIGYLAET